MAEKDIFELSDEEIAKMNPPEIKEEEENKSEPEEDIKEEEEADDVINKNDDSSSGSESSDEDKEDSSNTDESSEDSEDKEETEQKTEKQKIVQSNSEIDYKKFYETVMAPHKANGKTLQLRSPEEVIRLIQMGANYTQKMQNIAPYRKKIQTLQKAGLLEDEKLNYLIDLSQGNPEAIKKLLRDSKLDPMDLDIQNEPNYVPGNHAVSDAEARFQMVLDDLKSTPEGLETMQIARNWDQASLREIGNDPSILSTLHEQRLNGIFKLITDEMDHQRLLGNIPEGTPFLQAYKNVGDALLRQQQYLQQQRAQQEQIAKSLPQGTLTKPVDKTKAQVKSAAPSVRTQKAAERFVDPFTMSDEEFEKQFANYR